MEYMMIRINMEKLNEIAMQQKKGKADEGWLTHPEKVPYCRDGAMQSYMTNQSTGGNRRMSTTGRW
jgi:hypothetical protein